MTAQTNADNVYKIHFWATPIYSFSLLTFPPFPLLAILSRFFSFLKPIPFPAPYSSYTV